MKSNKKRILFVLAILTMALVLSCALVACDKKGTADKPNSNDLGVYYEVVGSSLDEKSYIELKSGNVWYDGEDQGTFKINGGNITLYDGDLELMSGTISNGVLTLSFMGETTVYKKSGSMSSGNVDQKAMIKSIQNGKVDGLTVSLEIDNTVEDVDLSGMITTSKDCSWQLYTSRTATSADAIVTKIIVPKNGNNTYYIVVTSADGKTNRTYTLNVWKNYYVTLSFYANGSFYTSEQVLTHTTYGSGPSCSVAGYTFNGWGCDGYYVTESKSFNANLTPLTYTAKFDSNGGSTLSDKTATFNKDLSLPTPYRTGYTFLGWYLNGNLYNGSIKYTYTNDITFTARWQINSYNVVIKSDNKELGTVQAYNGKKDYNSSVSLSATTKLGCFFVGWFANGTKISTNKTCTINVPAYDVTYVAIFEKDERLANFKCSMTENSCVITGVLDKNITTVLIPDYVTGIGDNAFSGCTGLTSVTIGSGVTSIGSSAFSGCTGLTTVNWNATACKSAGSSDYPIFKGCSNLATVNIGDNVKIIPSYAFYDFTGLTSVTIPDSVTSIGYSAFRSCTGLTSVTIPDSVTSIGNSAFYYCTGLTSVTIPDSVTSIGDRVFYDCSGLTSITIPDSVTSIGFWAFSGCSNLQDIYITDIVAWCNISGLVSLMGVDASNKKLYINNELATSITIPDGVTEIPSYAFYKCTGLTSITIPNSVTSIGSNAFSGCRGLTSITIPNSVKSIGNDAFSDCTGLTTVNWNATACTSAGSSDHPIFKGCSNLATVNIGDNVKIIPSDAFYDFTGLSSVTIGNSVTSIGERAFRNCTGLSSITIPDSVTSISAYAFSGCTGLTSVTIPDSVTSIDSYAFSGCTGLTSITIPDSVTSIGNDAFSGTAWYNNQPDGLVYAGKVAYDYKGTMPSNTSIVLKEGTLGIAGYAFYGCTGLTSVTIPDSVTSIGSNAFSGCRGLTSITIPNSVTSIGNSAFYNTAWYNNQPDGLVYAGKVAYDYKGTMPSNTSIVLKEGTLGITGYAFYGCTGLTSITIPGSVTIIGFWAFNGCKGLTSIYYTGDVASWCGISGLNELMSSSRTLYIGGKKVKGDLIIPNGVTSIGDYAFYGCKGLTSITIPDSVTSIGGSAFSGCTGLTSITIPDSVTSIGNYAFHDCTGLTSVTIGKGVTSIGQSAFEACTGLTSITVAKGNTKYHSAENCLIETESKTLIVGCKNSIIPTDGSVTSIGWGAFAGCTGLTSITISGSVTSIGDWAFNGCTGLTSITFNGTIKQWNAVSKGYYWKNNVPSACKVICTDGTVSI